MDSLEMDLLSEIEADLRNRFNKKEVKSKVPSTAGDLARAPRLDQLVLSKEERGSMPLTKDKYVVREDPNLVAWERVTREFLRNLSPDHGHRVAAVMIYEWATGIKIAELMAAGGSASPDLRKLNKILRFYFGKSYTTYIAGRKVASAYKIKPGYYIKRHRPMTLALWVEYGAGTLAI